MEFEESERQRREEDEKLQREMEELGIYEDTSIGTGIGSDEDDSDFEDDDEEPSQLGESFRLFRAKGAKTKQEGGGRGVPSAGRHTERMRSGLASQQKSGSAAPRRGLPSSANKGLGSRLGSAASKRASLTAYRRPSSLMAREDSTSSRRSSIFELRPMPTGVYGSTAPLPVESHTLGNERRQSAATQRHVEALRQTPVSATLERRSGRSAGNWERHLKNVPYRLEKKVYLTLPYHDLNSVSGPEAVMSSPPAERSDV